MVCPPVQLNPNGATPLANAVAAPSLPPLQETFDVTVAPTLQVAKVIVKLLFDTSKNVPLAQITITLAVVEATLGTVTGCVPSFGTLLANTVGNVAPPSVDNKISTLAQATGARSVPDTSQVTVSVLLPAHAIPVFDG